MPKIHINCFGSSEYIQSAYAEQNAQSKGTNDSWQSLSLWSIKASRNFSFLFSWQLIGSCAWARVWLVVPSIGQSCGEGGDPLPSHALLGGCIGEITFEDQTVSGPGLSGSSWRKFWLGILATHVPVGAITHFLSNLVYWQ
jgi:hypothetical protein